MQIGVPKERKNAEFRVGLTPSSVRELVLQDHQVLVEQDAGTGIGFSDVDYKNAGAKIIRQAEKLFSQAELIVKVKEPQLQECQWLQKDQIIFTYLHLAVDPEQTRYLLESECSAVAYETVTDGHGGLPLLSPMSEVAGRLALQMGANCLVKTQEGCGILLGGVPGVDSGKVLVVGGGVVGTNAARMAIGKGAQVTIVDKSLHRLKALDLQFGSELNTLYSNVDVVEHYVAEADLVIGATLVPGGKAPKLVTRDMLKKMRPGSVLVDVSIDQGGCFETSRPTTHEQPTFIVDDIVHYCVTNMPGAVPRTSTMALNNATLPFVHAIAEKGLKKALQDDEHLLNGLNVHQGKLTHEAVAKALDQKYVPAVEVLI